MLLRPLGLDSLPRVREFTQQQLEYVKLRRIRDTPRRRRPPMLICDPHDTGLWRNGAYNRPDLIPAEEVFCAFVPRARVTGHRLVVTEDGGIVSDIPMRAAAEREAYVAERLNQPREDCDFRNVDGQLALDRLDEPEFMESRPCVSLLSLEPSNYGSWLFRMAAKIGLMQLFGLQELCVVCWAPLDWQKQILAFFGIPEDRIISIDTFHTYFFPNGLFVPCSINRHVFLDDLTLAFFYKKMREHGIEYRPSRQIVVSRLLSNRAGKSYYREFIDEEAFLERMQGLGFEAVAPDLLSFRDQVELFASASRVIGASGSAMFNTMFSPPGAFVLDIEAFPHWLYAHTNLFASTGLNYGLAFGHPDPDDPAPVHKRWTIDIDAVASCVEDVLRLPTVEW